MSALGQKQTYAAQKAMSALPPKADMCGALAYVCFVPIADYARSNSITIRSPRRRARAAKDGTCEAKRLGGLKIDHQLVLGRISWRPFPSYRSTGVQIKKRPRLSGRTLANRHEAHRCTSTGILECVSTLTVSLPRTTAEMPWRPCEAMTTRSQPFDFAVSMIAW